MNDIVVPGEVVEACARDLTAGWNGEAGMRAARWQPEADGQVLLLRCEEGHAEHIGVVDDCAASLFRETTCEPSGWLLTGSASVPESPRPEVGQQVIVLADPNGVDDPWVAEDTIAEDVSGGSGLLGVVDGDGGIHVASSWAILPAGWNDAATPAPVREFEDGGRNRRSRCVPTAPGRAAREADPHGADWGRSYLSVHGAHLADVDSRPPANQGRATVNDQRSTTEQLRDAVSVLNERGLCDAADFIKRHVEEVDARMRGKVLVTEPQAVRRVIEMRERLDAKIAEAEAARELAALARRLDARVTEAAEVER